MSSEKRTRTHEEMSKETSGKDYAVCDQCRIKKIRCGREKPFCSNCTRLGHKCEWSGNGKKGNQTALLSHTIEGLSRRLESLEDALVETQNTVKRLASGTPTLTTSPAALQFGHTWPTPEDTSPTSCESPIFKRPLGHFLRSQNGENTERYFDPTSLESLLYSIRDSLLEPLVSGGSENQSVRESALLAQQKLDRLLNREETTIRNGILPTAPPISILKAMVEPYFSTINSHFPIWTKESFMEIVAALQETESSDQDLGRIVCSNNVILMTLAANLLQPPPHPDKSSRSRSTRGASSIDLDLTKGFLANARRAIEHADVLLTPRLINVQALLSLCIVAQEYMASAVFMRLFNMTAQCAKSIGLHNWERCSREQDTRERQYVSYCLYILDKTVCWTTGACNSIPTSDIYIETPESSNGMTMNNHIAKAKLAEIQEEIYLEIYTLRAPARTENQARLIMSQYNQKLQDWLVESSKDQEDPSSVADLRPMLKVELTVGCACTQLLYVWPWREHPDAMAQRVEISRRCMKLMLRLWSCSAELGHQGILPRVIASYPPLYLYEIYSHLLDGGEGQDSSDLELLKSFIEMLQSVADLQEENSYNSRLCEVSSILMDVVSAKNTQHKRRKTYHTPSSSMLLSSSKSPMRTHHPPPYTPSSDAHAQYNENNTSQIQNDSQSTSNITNSSFESLISPADSGSCAEDQLATLIGSLDKVPFENFDILGYSDAQMPRGENVVEKEIWWD